jgi:universal stress protein A
MLQFKNVLCPIDFSETSARALTYATALARWYDAHLEVLHVVPAFEHDVPPTRFDTAGGAWPSRKQLIIEIEGAIAAAGASGPKDLIVMCAEGTRGLELYGSNTQHVLRAATCPVLTVRA